MKRKYDVTGNLSSAQAYNSYFLSQYLVFKTIKENMLK